MEGRARMKHGDLIAWAFEVGLSLIILALLSSGAVCIAVGILRLARIL